MSYAQISATDKINVWRGLINGNTEALRSSFAGTSFPVSPSPVAGQLCLRTDTSSLYIYDGSGWVLLFDDVTVTAGGLIMADGSVVMTADFDAGGFKLVNVDAGTDDGDAVNFLQLRAKVDQFSLNLGAAAVTTTWLVMVPDVTLTEVAARVSVTATIAASGANYWRFKVRNHTASLDLRTADVDTQAGLTAKASLDLDLNQNLTPGAGAVLELTATRVGTPADLAGLVLTMAVKSNS